MADQTRCPGKSTCPNNKYVKELEQKVLDLEDELQELRDKAAAEYAHREIAPHHLNITSREHSRGSGVNQIGEMSHRMSMLETPEAADSISTALSWMKSESAMSRSAKYLFQQADADGDGTISKKEWPNLITSLYNSSGLSQFLSLRRFTEATPMDCIMKHGLTGFEAPEPIEFSCHECEAPTRKGDVVFACQKCSFLACKSCFETSKTMSKAEKMFEAIDGADVKNQPKNVKDGRIDFAEWQTFMGTFLNSRMVSALLLLRCSF